MTTYRAIVSITFDDDDLAELADHLGIDTPMAPYDAINGALDNFPIGSGWVEQLFQDGRGTIERLSPGLMVEVNPHE